MWLILVIYINLYLSVCDYFGFRFVVVVVVAVVVEKSFFLVGV